MDRRPFDNLATVRAAVASRRGLVSRAVAAVAAAGASWSAGRPRTGRAYAGRSAPTEAATSFASGGLGLTRAEWEALHGVGTAGQGYWIYNAAGGGAYFVGFPSGGGDGPIGFLERCWACEPPPGPRFMIIGQATEDAAAGSGEAGVDLAAAEAEIANLMPADARPGERYGRLTAVLTSELREVRLYHSASLADRRSTGSGNLLVLYYSVGPPAFGVTRVSLTVE